MKVAYPAVLLAFLFLARPLAAATVTDASIVTVNDVRIHYLLAGPKNATHTLLLIPGWRMTAAIWEWQIDYFSTQGYRVVAMDPRSQGDSSVVLDANAPENRAEDIRQLISDLSLKHIVMVGWSQGAQDVAAYVARYGVTALDGLILVDSPVSSGLADIRENPAFVESVLKRMPTYAARPDEYTDGMLHAIISTQAPPVSFALLRKKALNTPTDIGIAMLIQDMFTVDRRPALKLFTKPTLVIASSRSPLLMAQRKMLKLLPQGEFRIVDDASHAVFVDQPDIFNRMVMAFIASLDVGRGRKHPAHDSASG